MATRRFLLGFIVMLGTTFAVCSLSIQSVYAQGGGTGGTGGSATAGVAIDANGVMQRVLVSDPMGLLRRQRLVQGLAKLDSELAKPSKLRKVSLTRLEAEIAKLAAEGKQPTDAMKCLAGLTDLQYVFYYPETKDIVLAGPAEPFADDLVGRTIGLESGQPVLLLEDMVVALRAFPPEGRSNQVIFCSIDPTPQGLANMQQFLKNVGSVITPADTPAIVMGLQQSLGLQDITLNGVPPESHFAHTIVEADYLMKLIGIGLEKPPVDIKSYAERSTPAPRARTPCTAGILCPTTNVFASAKTNWVWNWWEKG